MAESKNDDPEIHGCCSVCAWGNSIDKDSVGSEKAQSAVLTEKAVDKTVSRITSNLSWASSGLLGTAMEATISFNFNGTTDWLTILASWLYVIILFVITALFGCITRDLIDTPDAVGKELDATVPAKKAKRGDVEAKEAIERQISKQKEQEVDKSPQGVASRLVEFAETETELFRDNLFELAIAIFANVVAIALKEAAIETFEKLVNDDDLTVGLYWIFALIISSITAYTAVKSGKYYDDIEIEIYDLVHSKSGNHDDNHKHDPAEWTDEEVWPAVLKFAAKRRFIKLINYILGLCMAWSWRDAFKYSIVGAYDGDPDDTSLIGLWTYCIVTSCIVAFINSLSERYYFLYPKDKNDISLQTETQERKIIGTVIYKNLQTIVGIAWYDVGVETADSSADGWDNVFILTGIIIVFTTLSIIGGYLWSKVWLLYNIAKKGAVTAIFAANKKLHDPNKVLERDEKEKEQSTQVYPFRHLYLKEFIELMVYAWGVAGGYSVSAWLKAILIETYEGVYDPDSTEDISGDVLWSVWVAWVIALVISAIVMYLLTKYQEKQKNIRKDELKKCASDTNSSHAMLNVVKQDSDIELGGNDKATNGDTINEEQKTKLEENT